MVFVETLLVLSHLADYLSTPIHGTFHHHTPLHQGSSVCIPLEILTVQSSKKRRCRLEQWLRLAALCDPLAALRSLDDSRQLLSSPEGATIDDLSHTIQAWENLEQRHIERTGDQ